MLNAIQPGSYLRPHRHLQPPRSEAWIALRGAVLLVIFSDDGVVSEYVVLDANSVVFGVDLVAGPYHTLAALKPDSVIYEVKTGPYEEVGPEEGSDDAQRYLEKLLRACGQDYSLAAPPGAPPDKASSHRCAWDTGAGKKGLSRQFVN